jgi:hypothetical protein
MIMDAQNRPSNAQAVTGTGTLVSTDSIDLLTANRNVGRSFAMRMVAVLPTALAGGTSIQAQLIESANSNLSSPTVLASGPTVALASAIAGAEILDVPIPGTTKRYLGVQYVLVGTFSGAGTVTAGVVAETDNQPYPAMNTGL